MLSANTLVFFSAIAFSIGGSDAATRIQYTYTATSETDPNPAPSANSQNVEIDYSLDSALTTSPRQILRKVYFIGPDCDTRVANAVPGFTNGVFDPSYTNGDETEFTVSESVIDIDAAVVPSGGTPTYTYSYCIRLQLETDKGFGTDFTVNDILEVFVQFGATVVDGTITIATDIDGAPVTPATGSVADAFEVTSYLCDTSTDETTDIAGSTTVSEGSPLEICFQSTDHPAAGIVALDAFALSSTLDNSGTPLVATQTYLSGGTAPTGAPVLTANTCTVADGTVGTATCHIGLNQLPTGFFLDTADNDAEDITVSGTATVTLRIGDFDGTSRRLEQRKVRFLLKEGDTGPVGAEVSPFTAARSDDDDGDWWAWFFTCCGLL